jgi:hypothetical protein
MKCQDKNNLDAHHIKPISKIIKRLTNNIFFKDEVEKFNFIINHCDIIDNNLHNGITLCRSCHKKAHKNWGSHVEP